MNIKVAAWIAEETIGDEEFGYYGEIEKSLDVGMGASIPVIGGRFGRYNVWCEIVAINDAAGMVKLRCGGKEGWVNSSMIRDALPHNEYVMLEAGANAGEAAMKFFHETAPTEQHSGSWDTPDNVK
jgi:hypothetical protein